MFKTFSILLSVCLSISTRLVGQELSTYKKSTNGIEINLPANSQRAGQNISLEIISEKIIRVRATPDNNTVKRNENLIVVPNLASYTGQWQVKEEGQSLILTTPAIKAIVSRVTGEVKFEDKAGRTLLSEKPRQEFIEDTHNGDVFYKVKQSFTVTEEEGLYGLGQHQNGIMNYNKGHQVTLLQYNTMIAVPFLLSTNNYGLLWHNYSITKAGDVRPLLPLSAFKLHSKEGYEGWLTVNYYDKKDPAVSVFTRAESEIDYLYLTDQDRLPKEVNLANSLVHYEGKIESPFTGLHRLHFNYSGYLKVWINGILKEDRWRESWNAGSFEIPVNMEAGKKYDIKLEWLPDGGQSYLGLRWQSPIPASHKNTFSFDSEAGDGVDYYFIAGNSSDDVISGYRYLTGKAPIMPKWSFGYWQSRERYKTQKELEDVASQFRKRKIPIDNMVQDWSYWREHDWGSHDFDPARFPDPKGMIDRLHKDNFRLMISVWPKVNQESSVYNDFKNKGWLYMRNIYDGRKDWIGKGYTSTFYDSFNADARKGLWDVMDKKLFKLGVDAWWMDASEPDVHSNINLQERKNVMQPAIGSSTRYYNAFPLENTRGIFEGQTKTDPTKRVFILTRSFFAGQQRYSAAAWSGDISSRWHDMKDQISAGINFSMSGTPYWTMDAGGFLVEKRLHKPDQAGKEEWRELNTRWFQYGAFLPMFRAHGQFPYREPFNIAPETHPAYNSMVYYINLRYRLLPYNYSLAGNTYLNNYTMIRGLAMDFGSDKKVYDINDQYLFGPSLLVNPITEQGKTSRSVYLPAAFTWYDFYNGQSYEGGKNIDAVAPYEKMPLFVKAGSLVPLGPELQYTLEKAPDIITLYVYAGADGEFTLYEDQGENTDYQNGHYSTIRMGYNDAEKTLTLYERQGTYAAMLAKRSFNIVFITPSSPQGYDTIKPKSKLIKYEGKQIKVKLK